MGSQDRRDQKLASSPHTQWVKAGIGAGLARCVLYRVLGSTPTVQQGAQCQMESVRQCMEIH